MNDFQNNDAEESNSYALYRDDVPVEVIDLKFQKKCKLKLHIHKEKDFDTGVPCYWAHVESLEVRVEPHEPVCLGPVYPVGK